MTADDPWKVVRGSFTATYASISQYGWKMPAWHSFLDAEGNIWDLRTTIPYSVLAKLREAISDSLWNRAMRNAGFTDDEGTPWMPTMRKAVQGKSVEALAYKQLLQGSQWNMQRRFQAHMVDTAICQACNAHIGDDVHMGLWCPHEGRAAMRRQYMSSEQIIESRDGFGGPPFACRGIVMKKWLPRLPTLKSLAVVTSHPRSLLQRFCNVV